MQIRRAFLIALLLITNHAFSQTDRNGNPVFNSITIRQDTVNDYHLVSSYYTLKNNIENKGSSVYISDKPTLEQVGKAATDLPSDFFVIEKNGYVVKMIMIMNSPQRQFFVIDPSTRKSTFYPCRLTGDISENRANEIVKIKYDPDAKIDGANFLFNNKKFSILSANDTKKSVIELIEKEKLNEGGGTGMRMITQAEIKAKILEESKAGGKMDFFTEIKGHEYDGIEVKPGLIATRGEIALYKWGRTAFEAGLEDIDTTLALWAQFKGRPANDREKRTITMGFNKDWEK